MPDGTARQAGRLKLAAGHYERLYQANPRNTVVLNNLAWLYGELKDPRALKTAEQAHALSPEDPAVLYTLGCLALEAGQVRRGLGLLDGGRDFREREAATRLHAELKARALRPLPGALLARGAASGETVAAGWAIMRTSPAACPEPCPTPCSNRPSAPCRSSTAARCATSTPSTTGGC